VHIKNPLILFYIPFGFHIPDCLGRRSDVKIEKDGRALQPLQVIASLANKNERKQKVPL
jgi:hypothetical protein